MALVSARAELRLPSDVQTIRMSAQAKVRGSMDETSCMVVKSRVSRAVIGRPRGLPKREVLLDALKIADGVHRSEDRGGIALFGRSLGVATGAWPGEALARFSYPGFESLKRQSHVSTLARDFHLH